MDFVDSVSNGEHVCLQVWFPLWKVFFVTIKDKALGSRKRLRLS